MRPLVGVDALQVGHVPHDGVLIQDAVGAKDGAGLAADLEGDVHVVHLGHGDLGGGVGLGILEAAQLMDQ